MGEPEDQKLFLQHDTHWIEPGLPDEGQIILFNNQAGTLEGEDFSSVATVELPVAEDGSYSYDGGAFEPQDFSWHYEAPVRTSFFSNIISGVQRLPNRNTLICQGVGGQFFEVDEQGNTVWRYINPVTEDGPLMQGELPIDNSVFRCTRLSPDHPGLAGKSLDPQGYIETGSTFSCEIPTANISNEVDAKISLYPNPVVDRFYLALSSPMTTDARILIFDSRGRLIYEDLITAGSSNASINIEFLNSGIYHFHLTGFSTSIAFSVLDN